MRRMAMILAAAGWLAAGNGWGGEAGGRVSLDECIRESLRRNSDIRAATERVAAARAASREARSAYYPWVNAGATYARTDNPPQAFMMSLNQRSLNMVDPAFNPNEPGEVENLRGSVSLQYRLYDFGRREMDTDMADLGVAAGEEGLRAVRNELVHQVHRGFYGALQARGFTVVQEEAVKSIQESLRVARERLASGSALKTDVLNLEVQLGQANEDLIRARNGHRLAIAALNAAIGLELAGTNGLADSVVERVIPPETLDYAALIERRPELQAVRRMAEMREKAAKRAGREYLPTLSLFGSVDWDSDPTDPEFEQSYMAGVALEVNLFDGFRTRHARARAVAEGAGARAEEEKARRNLKLDLIQAHLGLRESWERMAVARKSVENAEEALKITRERYQGKAADITELLMAQVGLIGSRARDVAAQYDYMIARSNLARAGGQWAETTWQEFDKQGGRK